MQMDNRRPPNLSLGRRSTVPDAPKRQSYSSLDKIDKSTSTPHLNQN